MTRTTSPVVRRYDCFETLCKRHSTGLINLCLEAWNNEIFDQDFTAESLVEELHIEGKQRLYLAHDENDDVVGYLIEVPFEKEIGEEKIGSVPMPMPQGVAFEKIAYLESIAVSAKHQGKGIGQALCQKFFEDCRARGFQKVVLFTLAKNVNGIKFFEKIGFKEFSRMACKISGNDDEFVYFYHNL